ncbi:MAG: Polysulfide reductase, NrfD, partial [Acidimicrobiales bacterium]|nr:Polysulfide reductase, NrfD [Acidimicrobiales bacterium]
VADTDTPLWHEARNDLPPLFAASAGASGGAATAALAALSGRPSRAAGLIGAVGATTEIALSELMRRRLGDLDTYGTDPVAHRLTRASTLLSGLGAIGLVAGRRSRLAIVGASAAVAAGSACLRLSVLRAGKASADDPRSVLRTAAAPPISTSEQEPGLTTRAAG